MHKSTGALLSLPREDDDRWNASLETGACGCGRFAISRQNFLRAALTLVAMPLLLYAPALPAALPESVSASDVCASGIEPALVEEVAPGVFVREGAVSLASPANAGAIANVGFVVGQKAVAVIDTGGSWCDGARLRAAIKARTALPIRYVINTHMHPDHVLGNGAFAEDGAEFIGHRRLAPALAARAEHYLRVNQEIIGADEFGPTTVVLPTRGVEESETIDLGGRQLELTAHPVGHTDNDLTVLDISTGTLWTGDLLFVGHIPVVDGRLLGWLKVLKELKKVEAVRAVPGHGPASVPWPAALDAERAYLEKLATDLRDLVKSGASIRDASKAAQSEAQEWQLKDDFHERNAATGYTELEWE
jgi:quinoprotein relay system zinc metallohydrolase 2